MLGVDQTAVLTCPVATPSGASNSFIVPELYAPGIPSDSRCVQPAGKPHVIMVGNQLNVTATFVNRCAEPHPMSESGLGWMLYERDDSRIGNADAGPRPVTRLSGVSRGKLESCTGFAGTTLAPGEVHNLTCDAKTLGAERVLLTPETYVPGNGYLVTDASPRVIIEAGHFAIAAQLRNRRPFNAKMSEGGLSWMRFVRGSRVNQSILFDNVASVAFQTCRGSADVLPSGATTSFGCSVPTPSGIRDALVTPKSWITSGHSSRSAKATRGSRSTSSTITRDAAATIPVRAASSSGASRSTSRKANGTRRRGRRCGPAARLASAPRRAVTASPAPPRSWCHRRRRHASTSRV